MKLTDDAILRLKDLLRKVPPEAEDAIDRIVGGVVLYVTGILCANDWERLLEFNNTLRTKATEALEDMKKLSNSSDPRKILH